MSQDLSNLNLGSGQHPALSGSNAPVGIQPTTSPDQTSQVGGQATKDSIEKAAAIVAALYLPPPNNPVLLSPDPNLTIVMTQLALDKICLCILDSWSKNLQEIKEQKKEDEIRAELNPIIREMQVTAGLFLAISTIFLRAIFGTKVTEALLNPGKNDEKEIVDQYAKQLATWGLDGTLEKYIVTIVSQLPSSTALTEAERLGLAKQIQIILLSSALASLYKLDTQWITSQEFANLLANPAQLNDQKAIILAALIVNTFNDLPEKDRMRIANMLNIYMDSNPDLPTLFDLGESSEIQTSILHASNT